jgi:hypothetical protein
MQLTLRKGTLADLANELQEQQDRKVDLVVPASKLWSHDGNVVVAGYGAPVLTDDGVTSSNLELSPSNVFDTGMVAKLSETGRPVGRAFVRGLRETGRTDLVDSIYNGLLHGNRDLLVPGDPRSFFLRTFAPGQPVGGLPPTNPLGYARAVLSDKYRPIDNLDVLLTVIKGLQSAGFDGHVVRQADLTDDKMYLRVSVPEITALAPGLLHGYTSPYGGARGADNPVVEAGIVITNSETGGAAFTITPELVVQICTNGMTIKKDMIRKTHLGSKMDAGLVRVSDETRRLNLQLVASQTKDAINTFLDADYMNRVIRQLESGSDERIADVEKTISEVVTRPAFSKADTKGLLAAFMDGGDRTRGGLVQAITAYSQQVDDADRAYEMDADALPAAGFGNVSGRVPVGR